MLARIKVYLSLVKFEHSIFSLPFALLGYFMATHLYGYGVEWWRLLVVVLCVVSARTAAMAFNRWADRHIDALNPRTAMRELPRGAVKGWEALLLVGVSCVVFVLLAFTLNPLCGWLSPVALAVVLGYSYTKRFTPLSHLILGMGLGLAPVGAFLAVAGRFAPEPVLLGVAVCLWVAGFDIIYALQDEEFDRRAGLHSLVVLLGRVRALYLSAFLHVLSATLLAVVGVLARTGPLYWVGLVLFSVLLARQHLVVSPADLSRVNLAFFTLNGWASVLFGVFAIADMIVV